MANGRAYWGGRDLNCALDVNQMAELGKFPVDFNVYGCAYIENGRLCYRVSSNKEKMYIYVNDAVYNNIYPTMVEYLMRSTCILSDQQEEIMEETKYLLVDRLRSQYKKLFSVLQPFAEQKANNNSYVFLREMIETIDGNFDDGELQLLEGAMDFALRAKVLTKTGYQQLKDWVKSVRKQMIGDTVIQDTFGRTFYGFGYEQKKGVIKYCYNAQKAAVYEQQQNLCIEGKLVMPIYQRKYWFSNFNQLRDIKEQFLEELQQTQTMEYLQFLRQLKTLPGVISEESLQKGIEELINKGENDAVKALLYYKNQWNFS